ncbi:MAG: YolD-like family protein [Bacilli bacterium]|nr:YolD-like family protein [Bacilli bacterium]
MREGERGMVKYAPYQSLTAQADALRRMREQKRYIDKPLISYDKAEEINRALTEYDGGEITLVYWQSGRIERIHGHIRKIDPVFHLIYIDEARLSLPSIIDVEP